MRRRQSGFSMLVLSSSEGGKRNRRRRCHNRDSRACFLIGMLTERFFLALEPYCDFTAWSPVAPATHSLEKLQPFPCDVGRQ